MEVLKIFEELFQNDPVDIDNAIDIFVSIIYKKYPNKHEKILMDNALTIFCRYREGYNDDISHLVTLSTILSDDNFSISMFDKLFTEQPINISCAINLYIQIIYKHMPNDDERKLINKILLMFSNCWKQNIDTICNNMSYLSKLAAIFSDEPFFVEEYDTICLTIQNIINNNATRYNEMNTQNL